MFGIVVAVVLHFVFVCGKKKTFAEELHNFIKQDLSPSLECVFVCVCVRYLPHAANISLWYLA